MEDSFAKHSDIIRVLAADGYVRIKREEYFTRLVLHAEATPLAESFLSRGGYTMLQERECRKRQESEQAINEVRWRQASLWCSVLSAALGFLSSSDWIPTVARGGIGLILCALLLRLGWIAYKPSHSGDSRNAEGC